MDCLRGIKAGGDMIKDGADVLGAMLLCHLAHHCPGCDIQGCEQCRRAVSLIVMCAGLSLSRLERQGRLCPPERLDLRLLVHREHHRVIRRIHIEPHHILGLDAKAGVVGQLEGLDPVRFEAMAIQDAVNSRDGETDGVSHSLECPVGAVGRWWRHRQVHSGLHLILRNRRLAPSVRAVAQQPVHALHEDATPPAPDSGL